MVPNELSDQVPVNAVRGLDALGVRIHFGWMSASGDRVAELPNAAYAVPKGGWMSSKKTDVVDIRVDELALSLVGWQVEDAQARLITESHDRTDHEQQLAVSATFRFLSEDWTDRFKSSDGDDYASSAFLTLNRRDAPAPTSNYDWIILGKIRKAKKGLIRVSAKTDTWTCRVPLAPKDLDLRLTAYDFDHVSDLYINSKLSLPSPTTIPLEIIVVDETSVQGPRAKITAAHAYVSKGHGRTTLTVHTEGAFEFGTAEDLLKAYLDRRDRGDPRSTVEDYAPFEVDVPEIRFEILDDTGFLLENRICKLYGHIPVDDQGSVPRRQPRWVGRSVINMDNLPGYPQRVVVRVTDGDE